MKPSRGVKYFDPDTLLAIPDDPVLIEDEDAEVAKILAELQGDAEEKEPLQDDDNDIDLVRLEDNVQEYINNFYGKGSNTIRKYNFDFQVERPIPENLPAYERSIVNRGLRLNLLNNPGFITGFPKDPEDQKELDALIHSLVRDNIIYENKHPKACSPIYLIRKSNGSPRLIHDLRNVNRCITKKSAYMLKSSNIRATLQGAKFFAKADLSNGYYHIPIHKDDSPYLSFKYKEKYYSFKRLPFGLSIAPAIFQRVAVAIGKASGANPLVYLDDFLFYGKTKREVRNKVKMFKDYCVKNNWLINEEKSIFLPQTSIEFLGLIIRGNTQDITIKDEIRLFCLSLCNQFHLLSDKVKQSALGFINFYRISKWGSLAALRLLRLGFPSYMTRFFSKDVKVSLTNDKVKKSVSFTDATSNQIAWSEKKTFKVAKSNLNIFFNEALGIIKALMNGANHIINDNLPALFAIRKGAFKDPTFNKLIYELSEKFKPPELFWIPSELNPADAFSRLDLNLSDLFPSSTRV